MRTRTEAASSGSSGDERIPDVNRGASREIADTIRRMAIDTSGGNVAANLPRTLNVAGLAELVRLTDAVMTRLRLELDRFAAARKTGA